MKVEEIANCLTGLVLKRYEGSKTYPLLSQKYIDELGFINDTETFYGENVPDTYFLKKDDIVMKIASPNNAIYIPENCTGTVVSSFFFLIRVDDREKINPRFLTVYFNSPPFREAVEQALICSTVKSLKISTLKQMFVPEISMDKQEEIITIAEAMRGEEFARKELCLRQHDYYRKALTELIGNVGGD